MIYSRTNFSAAVTYIIEEIMPKIEVNEKLFFNLLVETYDYDTLERKLTCAKAELDELPDMSTAEGERTIK